MYHTISIVKYSIIIAQHEQYNPLHPRQADNTSTPFSPNTVIPPPPPPRLKPIKVFSLSSPLFPTSSSHTSTPTYLLTNARYFLGKHRHIDDNADYSHTTYPDPGRRNSRFRVAYCLRTLTDTCIDGFEWDAYGNGGYAVEHASRWYAGGHGDTATWSMRAGTPCSVTFDIQTYIHPDIHTFITNIHLCISSCTIRSWEPSGTRLANASHPPTKCRDTRASAGGWSPSP